MEASWGESKAYILTHNTKLPEEKGDLKGTTKASLTKVDTGMVRPTDLEMGAACAIGEEKGHGRPQGQSEGRGGNYGRETSLWFLWEGRQQSKQASHWRNG